MNYQGRTQTNNDRETEMSSFLSIYITLSWSEPAYVKMLIFFFAKFGMSFPLTGE